MVEKSVRFLLARVRSATEMRRQRAGRRGPEDLLISFEHPGGSSEIMEFLEMQLRRLNEMIECLVSLSRSVGLGMLERVEN